MSFSRQFRAKLVFDSFEVTDDVFSVKVKSGLNLGDELTLGTTTSATCTVEVYANGYNYKNKKFQLFFGLKLDSGEFEYIPYGVYTVLQVAKKDYKVTLTCADFMSKTDKIFSTSLRYPATAEMLLDEICNKLKLNYEVEGLKNISIPFRPAIKSTARELIGKIASLAGKNAIFDREGVLRFVWYSDSGVETDTDYIDAPEISEEDFVVKYLLYNVTSKITDLYGDKDSLTGITVSNEFVLGGKQSDVWESVKDFAYKPSNLKQRLGNVLIDVWDVITVKSNGAEIKTIPMKLDMTYDGGITVNISAKAPDTEKGYKSPAEMQAEKQAEKDENNSLVLTASNNTAISVTTTEKKLLDLKFNTQSENIPYINATVQLEETTAGVVTLLLKINGSINSAYRISPNIGYNVVSFSSAFLNLTGGSHEMSLHIIGEANNSAVIQAKQANVILTGYGLVAQASWNGMLNLNDVLGAVVSYVRKISVQGFDSSISIKSITPNTAEIIEKITAAQRSITLCTPQSTTESQPYNIVSVSNPTNDTIEFVFANMLFMRSVGAIDTDNFAITGFLDGTPTAVTVYQAGLEKPFADNLISMSADDFDIADNKLVSAAVDVSEDKEYVVTFLNCTRPFTEAALENLTESQLDFYTEIELEGRQYKCDVCFYNADGELLDTAEVTEEYYQLAMPEGTVSVRVVIAEITGRTVTADDLSCFYVKLEEGAQSTVYRFSNKVVLKVDDLSQMSESINYYIGDIGLLDVFTNQTVSTEASGAFNRTIYEGSD